MYPNNGGYGQPNNNYQNYNQYNQGQYPGYIDQQTNYNNYGYQNPGSAPQPAHNQPKWQNRPKAFPKRNNNNPRPPKQAARGYPPANYNQQGYAGNQYGQGGYNYHQAPQPVPYQQTPNRPPQPRAHTPKQPGYGPPGQFRGSNARPHQGRGRGGPSGYGARGPKQPAPYHPPQVPQANFLSPLSALASLGPLAPAVLNNMDTQQLVNLLLTPTQNLVAALPSTQAMNRPQPQNFGRGQGRAQPGHRKVIPSKKFAPQSRGVPSGPQRPATGARQQHPKSHEPKPKKEKQDNFVDNINKTFVQSLIKPDSHYATAVLEQLDDAARMDQSAAHEQIIQRIVTRTKNELTMAQAIVTLLESGCSVPFIHAYKRNIIERKSLAELRDIERQWREGNNLAKYKQYILHAIFTKGKLTADLKTKISAASSFTEVADYYIPIKLESNPRTAPIKVVGLDKLTAKLLDQTPFDTPNMNLHAFAMSFIKPEQGYPDYPSVMKAAVQLAAEQICSDQSTRDYIRQHFIADAIIKCTKSNKLINIEKQNKDLDYIKRAHKFRDYFQVYEPLSNLSNTRVLTMNKGEREGYLHAEIEFPHDIQGYLKTRYLKDASSDYALYIANAVEQAWRQYLLPIFAAEVRARAAERASEPMTSVIYNSVYQSMLQPPVRGAVMGIDPGYKSGCRVTVINERGVLQTSTLIYPHPPISQPVPAKEALLGLYRQHSVIAVAIAQGFGARETERFLANINSEFKTNVKFMIVNEMAAVCYAASELGREEFPSLDTQMRAAVSVARRLQDPMEELVKVEVDAIGVHPLQQEVVHVHSMLESGVIDAVNSSLIDINTASVHQLHHVSGLNMALAREIVSYRAQNKFTSRQQLLSVPQFTPHIYEQCAGFLRIAIDVASNALDSTNIHPADYALAEKVLQSINESIASIKTSEGRAAIKTKLNNNQVTDEYLQQLEATTQRGSVQYIIDALKDPLTDPRDSMPKPALKADVPRMTDLTIGKVVEGVVTNITPFGLFMDLGMKQTGFVHKTEVSDNAGHTPASVAHVGDVLRARVTSLDFQRDRIVLSLRSVPAEGESVPESVGQQAPSIHIDNNSNTNVMPSTSTQSNVVPNVVHEEPADESHHEGPHDEVIDMNEEQQEYDEMQGEGEEYPHDGDEYVQEMHDEEQYGEEYAAEDDSAVPEHNMEEVANEGEEYTHGEEPYGEDNNNTVDDEQQEHHEE